MNEKFCKLLKNGLEDEAKAGKFYDELIKEITGEVSPSESARAAIRTTLEGIKDSEESHHKVLKNIEKFFCSGETRI